MTTNWENLIHKRVSLAKLCVATENFSSFHVLAADQAKNASILSNLAPEQKAGVDKINTDTVEAGQKNYNEFSTEVERLKDQPAEPKAWELKIRSSAANAKDRSNDMIDKAANDAIAYIGKLPEPARDSAGSAWANGMNAVVAFFEEIFKNFQAIIETVVKFFQGVWDQITKSWSAVKVAAQAAISFITGFIPFGVPSVRHAFLPISASLSSVQDQVLSYLKQLSSNGTTLSRLTINKQALGWEIDMTT